MKKKLLAMLLTGAMVLSLAACGGTQTEPAAESDTTATETEAETEVAEAPEATEEQAGGYELALVTDLGTIDDKSFNQGAWEGLAQYAEEFGKTYKYYQPQEATTDSYVETIGLAIEGGAKVVVCPGFLFETPVYIVQEQYPDVSFILLDGEPHNEDYSDYTTAANTMAILYQEDQPGYLAGYASVKDGMTKLGFMGGMAVPAVVRFGYGFVQGADAAATEMGVNVDVMYHYTGAFAATPEAQAMAASWYQNGTEVIFGCGGAVGNSVMAAAEEAGAKVIGVDVDQSFESDTVITSAMKKLSVSVYDGIRDYYDGSFPGGSTSIFSAENDGIGLPMETSKFTNFTQDDYDAILAGLVDGSITINNDVSDTTTADLTLSSSKVTFVE
ncbi:BMP family lipoprotein [Kineothrix sp. MB12-C1]|uniref:BMP family lipoprotein n=1 Tax=Kineothrix sp. MB12-C1 TaxID=3070215 RepID=UPI0027D1FA52|nr:BMP family ABC transporter substrate-binding protein [Kineothrix sp. MB12-C1]WMC92977.1 BMP family ABC transporter substrate-binding protein [Kineothrix sp. MB12-C1]